MPGGCILSFLLSIAGRGPIWPRQRLPWLRPISRFGTGAPSSALLSRFAVNKEKALPHPGGKRLRSLCVFSLVFAIAREKEEKRFYLARTIRYGYFRLSERDGGKIVFRAETFLLMEYAFISR